jgi:hypothetical protein
VLIDGLVALEGLIEGADCPARGGSFKFVDRLMINFPCTTRLSVDFLRSRVSISAESIKLAFHDTDSLFVYTNGHLEL